MKTLLQLVQTIIDIHLSLYQIYLNYFVLEHPKRDIQFIGTQHHLMFC